MSIATLPGFCQERSQSREATGEEDRSDSTHVGETRYEAVRGICGRTRSAIQDEATANSEFSTINNIYSAWVERSRTNPDGFGSYFSEKPQTSKYTLKKKLIFKISLLHYL